MLCGLSSCIHSRILIFRAKFVSPCRKPSSGTIFNLFARLASWFSRNSRTRSNCPPVTIRSLALLPGENVPLSDLRIGLTFLDPFKIDVRELIWNLVLLSSSSFPFSGFPSFIGFMHLSLLCLLVCLYLSHYLGNILISVVIHLIIFTDRDEVDFNCFAKLLALPAISTLPCLCTCL